MTTDKTWTGERHETYTVYEGYFGGANYPAIWGRIVEHDRLPTEVYVWNPPDSLRRDHIHGSCWQQLWPNEKWFKLHWTKPARDFTTCLLYVNNMIREASKRRTLPAARTEPLLLRALQHARDILGI